MLEWAASKADFEKQSLSYNAFCLISPVTGVLDHYWSSLIHVNSPTVLPSFTLLNYLRNRRNRRFFL